MKPKSLLLIVVSPMVIACVGCFSAYLNPAPWPPQTDIFSTETSGHVASLGDIHLLEFRLEKVENGLYHGARYYADIVAIVHNETDMNAELCAEYSIYVDRKKLRSDQKMYIRAPAGVIHRVTTPFLDNGNRLDVSEFKFIRTKPTDGLSYPGCW